MFITWLMSRVWTDLKRRGGAFYTAAFIPGGEKGDSSAIQGIFNEFLSFCLYNSFNTTGMDLCRDSYYLIEKLKAKSLSIKR